MNQLRVWLMLLLMLLLPVRGAMAAAMLCLPQDGMQNATVHQPSHGSSEHDHATHGHEPHAALADDTRSGHDAESASQGTDGCNLCASTCSLTPLASTVPDLHHPPAQAALTPALSAPAASFVLDAEDRPPRTI